MKIYKITEASEYLGVSIKVVEHKMEPLKHGEVVVDELEKECDELKQKVG